MHDFLGVHLRLKTLIMNINICIYHIYACTLYNVSTPIDLSNFSRGGSGGVKRVNRMTRYFKSDHSFTVRVRGNNLLSQYTC
jgi:hypothetical protein